MGNSTAEVFRDEGGVLVHFPCQKTLAKRTKRHKANPQFFERWDYFIFRLTPPQRVFALQGCNRLNGMCTADNLYSGFRKSEMFHFPFLNKVFHGTGNIFNRYVRVNPVLIKKVNSLYPESFQRFLCHFLNMLRPAVESGINAILKIKSEFSSYYYFAFEWFEGFAH